jgi:anti-sigma B factor antagonist
MSAQPSTGTPGDDGVGLNVRVVPGPCHVVMSVNGDIDMTTEQAFRDALMREVAKPAQRRVVVDLAGVGYMASAGLHVLLAVNQQVKAAGGSLVVACAQPIVARMLSLTRVDEVIPVANGTQEALAWARHGAAGDADQGVSCAIRTASWPSGPGVGR